jgi:hypothetical protein
MKSLEASEQEAKQREENFAELMREYSDELKEVKTINKNNIFLFCVNLILIRLKIELI